MTNVLFQPLRIGDIIAPNRVFMSPLTRGRSTDRVPNELMAEYYGQRASAGLIIAEATAISAEGYGWNGAPGIYSEAHVTSWKRVTETVHASGGRIFLQLWHMGRVSHPDFQNGKVPVGPSAIAALGETHTPVGKKPYVVPRALDASEIPRIVNDYATAAGRARDAGFDGVEVHGANGYLIDQFLRNASNRRTDQYGGSIENRVRFLKEVVEAVCQAWSPQRTGLRLSPTMNEKGMADSDPIGLFTYVARTVNCFNLAYLHTAESIRPGRLFNPTAPRVTPHIREVYDGVLVTNGGYEFESATRAIENKEADAIAFGQSFLANPDLPRRFLSGSGLNEPDPALYYTTGPHGYSDYPRID
jgi:N-ethylmaleimide reductase